MIKKIENTLIKVGLLLEVLQRVNSMVEEVESFNHEEFEKYNKNYLEKFKVYPNEITILTYDALGLIYYAWKKNGKIDSINNFSFKGNIKGKIGTFSFKDREVLQKLDIYKTEKNKFIKF